jgi:F-type H+-transporting ATPase subunit b
MIPLKRGEKKCAIVICLTLIGLVFFFGFGFASEGGGHGAAQDGKRLLDLGYRFLNFALLVIILVVVIRKTAIKDFFGARREEIKKKFEDLRKERDEAEGRYRELENELKAFEIKKKEIIEQFKTEGIAEKEKIIAEAEERKKQILEQTDLTIQREIQAAKDLLRAEMVEVAAQRAQQIIEKQIKDSDQDQLVNEFIERVEKIH